MNKVKIEDASAVVPKVISCERVELFIIKS